MPSTHGASFDSSRRTFRGRGGPTDRRLPKHNAARRRPTRTNDDSDETPEKKYDGPPPSRQRRRTTNDTGHADDDEEEDTALKQEGATRRNNQERAVKPILQERHSEAEAEIRHLTKRIRNVEESIKLSKQAIANPSTWQQNVLNPVSNCVNEWRAILAHFFHGYNTSHVDPIIPETSVDEIRDDDDDNNNDDEASTENTEVEVHDDTHSSLDAVSMTTPSTKEPALALFLLMQFALQSGPLAGGKPGYFKRCGSDAAQQALDFLNKNVPTDETTRSLCFSEKQIQAIGRWRTDAAKAIEKGAGPSKSVLKRQANASGRKK